MDKLHRDPLQIGTKDILGKVDEGKLQSTSQVGLLDHKKVEGPAHPTPNGSKNIKDAVKELRTQGKIQKPIGIQ